MDYFLQLIIDQIIAFLKIYYRKINLAFKEFYFTLYFDERPSNKYNLILSKQIV